MGTVIRADKVKEDTLEDKDGDTKVSVEESGDEDKIRFDTAGTQRMIIDEAGQVGIGTDAPEEQFHIHGSNATLRLGNGVNSGEHSPKIQLSEMADSSGDMSYGYSIGYNGTSNNFEIKRHSNSVSGNEVLIANRNTGDIGIKTASPEADLHVYGGNSGQTFSNVTFAVENAGSSDSFYAFQTATSGGGKSFSITNGGKVGIGTTTPISELDIAGKISITSESDTPSQPSDGQGYLYSKSDGKLYWRSYDVSETDLTATGGGGGSSSDTFVMFQQIEQVNNLSTSYYYYKNVTGGYGWTNLISPTNFSTTFPYWRIHRYASSGTVPTDCSMTKYRVVGHKDGTDDDTITLKIWRVPAATHGVAETDAPTLVEVVSVEINADGDKIINKEAAVSSNNSFSAGDSWFVTINPTSAYMTSDHYLQLSVEFTVS